MRKYFLLSAVALMISGIAQASEGTFNASVSVKEATQLECDRDLNFGTLVVVNKDLENFTSGILIVDEYNDVTLSVTSGTATHQGTAHNATCLLSSGYETFNINNVILDYDSQAWSGIDMILTPVIDSANDELAITGKLQFSDISAGDYTTTVNVFILEE
ncbi:MAG: hypothetical protein IJF12_01355 [Alphaproteobacteria bacterium]|nr:hypothetical protein [Alphaproteobacteria bacterium]